MNEPRTGKQCAAAQALFNRREFLILGGSSVAVLGLAPAFAPDAHAQLVMSSYPELRIAALAALELHKPIEFFYPIDTVRNFAVRLGERAGAAVGPDEDVVAFNAVCTHMGGPVGPEFYKPQHAVVGPCPMHLTTFDLTRHGMVVSGHATESLPQIALEIRDGDVFAVGIMGLVYGYHINPTGTGSRTRA